MVRGSRVEVGRGSRGGVSGWVLSPSTHRKCVLTQLQYNLS